MIRSALGSSPHTRGAPGNGHYASYQPGIIPAYAGSTKTPVLVSCGRWDHPRIRGEHVPDVLTDSVTEGSSPHTRGAHGRENRHARGRGIIPAYAGSTHAPAFFILALRDHPRIRGEHQKRVCVHLVNVGSSPHTRGARRRSAATTR